MTDHARAARLAERIHVLVAKLLERGIKDPRLGFVTITDVRVTGDLQNATIYYTVLGSDEEREESAAALKSATGRIRSEVGKNLGIRLTPTITFVFDGLPENAQQIDSLLEKARQADAQLAQDRAGKSFAGEADPYRHEDADDEAGEPETER